MKKQFRYTLRLLIGDALTVLLLFFLASQASGQSFAPQFEPCVIGSYEIGRGIVAAEGLAVVRARQFVTEPQQALMPNLPTTLAGVRVWIGEREDGALAGIVSVGADRIVIQMPSLPRSAVWLYGWQRVEVESPLGNYLGWAVVMPVSAEIFTNRCVDTPNCVPSLPFGMAWVNNERVYPTLAELIPNNNTQIVLYGNGFRNASRSVVWVTDEFGGWAMVEGGIASRTLFPMWDSIAFTLPATLERDGARVPLSGKITLQIAAQQPLPMRWWSFANPVTIQIQ